jgi:hypothetical protein
MTESDQPVGRFFTFTIDATTGQVVKFETFDASGAWHDLSEHEKAALTQAGSERLEEALGEAFEAGIDCVLGEEGQDEPEESAQEAELRQLLLSQLIRYSPAKHLLQREALNRVILGTLINDSIKPLPPASGRNTPGAGESNPAGGTRAN